MRFYKMINSSTYKILYRTLETTNTHPELDQSGIIEEKWGDISVRYKGYTKYDERNIPVIQQLEEDKISELRHTHLYADSSISERIDAMNKYYIEHNLGPYEFAFRGNSHIDASINEIFDAINNINSSINEMQNIIGSLAESLIFRGNAEYNPDPTKTPDDVDYLILPDGSPELQAGDIYQTLVDGKEWVFVNNPGIQKWVELGYNIDIPIQHVNASTNSDLVTATQVYDNNTKTATVVIDVSTSLLDPSTYNQTGYVTDAQLDHALDWTYEEGN